MHRTTSAEALATDAGELTTSSSIRSHEFLPRISDSIENIETATDASDNGAWDDVPLLQTLGQDSSTKPKHSFSVLEPDVHLDEQESSTAWREAAASLKLSAPITVQAISPCT